jgi:GldM C-terminal domain
MGFRKKYYFCGKDYCMKKTAFLFLLLGVMLAFTQSTTAPANPLIVTLYERMILYQSCANLVGTSVPTLGKNYRPAFSTDNGTLIPKEKLGECVIYPSKLGKCTMTISSGGKEMGDWEFTVLPIPAPNVYLGDNTGAEISTAELVKKGEYRIIARPDAIFLSALPKEANYRISGLTVNIYRKGQKVKSTSVENGALDLKDAQEGDMVQAIVTKTERINLRGFISDAMPINPVLNFMVKN